MTGPCFFQKREDTQTKEDIDSVAFCTRSVTASLDSSVESSACIRCPSETHSYVCACVLAFSFVHCHQVVYVHLCVLLFERDGPLRWIVWDSAGLGNAVRRWKQAGKKKSCLGFKELGKCLRAQVSISGRELLY